MFDFDYRKFGTKRQIEIMETVEKTGSVRNAAKYLGISRSSARSAIDSCKSNAAIKGGVEFKKLDPVPEGFLLKGESLLHNKRTGEDLLVWRKTKIDDAQRWEGLKKAIDNLTINVPRLKPIAAPKLVNSDLCNVAIVTDLHVGMRSWKTETGGDWDLKIAKETCLSTFRNLFSRAPKANTCVLVNLGDFLHYDGPLPVTPSSGHVLDADSRYAKMADTAIEILRGLIDMALATHKRVVVIVAEGNHDINGSRWLRVVGKALYANEPRIEFVESEKPYYAYKFGDNMFAFHHSHLTPIEKLDRVFAAMFPKIWGNTKHRFGWTGDKHHIKAHDQFGMLMQQVPTLATMDAYAARHGYFAARRASIQTFHIKGGEVAQTTADPEVLV